MSGLDPLGRRDVRALILELRDQGRTVFFSSHILADAEALCSRVAVVAGGRLAAAGRLADILAFQVRGWELVIDDLPPEVLDRIAPQLTERAPRSRRAATRSSCRSTRRPSGCSRELTATGASLVSLNPLRDTLEDFFVRRVAEIGRRRARRDAEDGADAGRLARSPSTSSGSRCATACPTTSCSSPCCSSAPRTCSAS